MLKRTSVGSLGAAREDDGSLDITVDHLTAQRQESRSFYSGDARISGNQNGVIHSMIPGVAAVRVLFLHTPTISHSAQWPAALIAAGLSVLLAAAWWPVLPAVTGMAIVALGATEATLARFRGSPALLPVLVVHLAVYGGLYALFVGAMLHAAAQADAGIGLAAAIDLTASIWPAAIAIGLVGGVLRGQRSAE
jgi:hypothetical protein